MIQAANVISSRRLSGFILVSLTVLLFKTDGEKLTNWSVLSSINPNPDL